MPKTQGAGERLAKIKPWTALVAALLILPLLLSASACSAPTHLGTPKLVDGGTEIVVPALWASSTSRTGGIEPATVWVDTSRNADQLSYEVNLSQIEAKGAGAQWKAATASAAAISSLFSGIDPDNAAFRFDITGPIDGPSAGGILTVGALAAINNVSLTPTTTMTGTISPDGSIGPVGLVGFKLQAAAQEGYTTALIPAMLTTVSDPDTDDPVDTQELGKKLGIEVVYVHNIVEAYQEFTGHSLFADSPASPYDFAEFGALTDARAQATRSLQDAVTEKLRAAGDAPSSISAQLEQSFVASNMQDWPTAFGLAVDALDQLADWQGDVTYQNNVSEFGDHRAGEMLTTHITEGLTVIDSQTKDVLQASDSMPTAQLLSLPGAVSWLTYASAVLKAVSQELTTSQSDAMATTAKKAALVEEVILEAQLVFPHVLAVLEATPGETSKNQREVAGFMSGYTNFLVDASDANLSYLHEVYGLTAEDRSQFAVTQLVPVVEQLSAEADQISPQTESVPAEIAESALAMTYFVTSTSLITSLGLFGSSDLWLNPEEANLASLEYAELSMSQSADLVSDLAAMLLPAGMNAGFPLWSAQWGVATYHSLRNSNRANAGLSIAFNELWFDDITVLSMNAFASSQ